MVQGCPGIRGAVDWATDLSLEGMRLERRLPIWPGTELHLLMHLPGQTDPVAVTAKVVAGHPSGTGLCFTTIEGDGRDRLARFFDEPISDIRDLFDG